LQFDNDVNFLLRANTDEASAAGANKLEAGRAVRNLIVGGYDRIAGRAGTPPAFPRLRQPSRSAASGEDDCEVAIDVDP